MQKTILLVSIATIMGWSQAVYAGAVESQNPHDPVNQADESDLDIRSDTNADTGGAVDAGSPNPNSLGRTGRINQIDQNTQRNRGIQTPPANIDNFGNIDDRIETINDTDRALRDRLDGSPTPTADPSLNSDRQNAEPIPPGQGPAVNPDASGTSGTSTGNSTSTISGPSSTSGSGAATSSGTTGGASTGAQ